ncbi:MAG: O-antigen ligase family protein [Halobacteriaceae archaeon]
MRDKRYTLPIIYIFLAGIFSTQSSIEQTVGYLLGMAGYAVLALFFYYNKDLKLIGKKSILAATLALSAIFTIPLLQSAGIPTIIRVILFPVIILVNVFVIPATVSQKTFYGALTRITAISTLVGFPALIVGSIGPIQAYPVIQNPPGFPVALPGLISIFGNPNTMGAIAVYGSLAALWEYFSTDSRLALALFFVNASGVYFSQGRAAALALLAGLSMIAVYHFTNRRVLAVVTVAGLVAAPILTLVKFGIIPGPAFVRNVDFNNRIQLWTAAFQAMLERPFFGWGVGNVPEAMTPYITRSYLSGAGPHTSYIRMFAASGVIGGFLYLYIYLKSMSVHLLSVGDNADAAEHGMVIGAIVLHTFSGISLFGIALVSVVPAIILGYAQYSDSSR